MSLYSPHDFEGMYASYLPEGEFAVDTLALPSAQSELMLTPPLPEGTPSFRYSLAIDPEASVFAEQQMNYSPISSNSPEYYLNSGSTSPATSICVDPQVTFPSTSSKGYDYTQMATHLEDLSIRSSLNNSPILDGSFALLSNPVNPFFDGSDDSVSSPGLLPSLMVPPTVYGPGYSAPMGRSRSHIPSSGQVLEPRNASYGSEPSHSPILGSISPQLSPSASASGTIFTDVSPSSTYAESVDYASQNGVGDVFYVPSHDHSLASMQNNFSIPQQYRMNHRYVESHEVERDIRMTYGRIPSSNSSLSSMVPPPPLSFSPVVIPSLEMPVDSQSHLAPEDGFSSQHPRFTQTAPPGKKRIHQCQLCPKAFTRLEHLKRHYRKHNGERPYPCTICKRPFSRSDNLAQHMRSHANKLEKDKAIARGDYVPKKKKRVAATTTTKRKSKKADYEDFEDDDE